MANKGKCTPEIIDEICERIAEGESLRAICRDPKMPSFSTVIRWLADEKNVSFRAQYARAREAQADKMADEILEIADESKADIVVGEDGVERINHEAVARSRLRVDARKWLASKMAPKKYGDRLELSGDPSSPVNLTVTWQK